MELNEGDMVRVESRGAVQAFEVVGGGAFPELRAAAGFALFPDGLESLVFVQKGGEDEMYAVESFASTAIGGGMAGKQVTSMSLRRFSVRRDGYYGAFAEPPVEPRVFGSAAAMLADMAEQREGRGEYVQTNWAAAVEALCREVVELRELIDGAGAA